MTETITASEEGMENENVVEETAPQPAQEESQTDASMEIGSLEEAMRAFNKAKSKASEAQILQEEAVGESGDKDKPVTEADKRSSFGVAAGEGSGSLESQSDSDGQAASGAGESSGHVELYDSASGVSAIRQELRSITADAVRKQFAKQGIKHLSLNDLMRTDENTGTREFINPDTKRPFQSSNPRSEAQAFVKDYNAEIDNDFRQACQNAMPQVENSYKPLIEFHEFLPTWQQMDEFRQEMFEELVAGHELTDNAGNIVAYDCDLNQINSQMERQIQWLLSQQRAMQAPASVENQVTRPAVAAKTSQASQAKGEDSFDLSNMNDALRYFNKQKKGMK